MLIASLFRRAFIMVLSILDSLKGQAVRITTPDSLLGDQHPGTSTVAKPLEHRDNHHRQDRPPVTSFDPHFGSWPNSNRPHRGDFDEMLWGVG
jgi:hypothetical protein